MKKFFENPSMEVANFDADDIITASGPEVGKEYIGNIDDLNTAYTVKTIDAATLGIDFTF